MPRKTITPPPMRIIDPTAVEKPWEPTSYTPVDAKEAETMEQMPDTQDEIVLHHTPPPTSPPPEFATGSFELFRGSGHLHDVPNPDDVPVGGAEHGRALGQLMPPGTETPDYVEHPTASIRDQGRSEECVAFTFARHINARLALLLLKDPDAIIWPSTTGIYGLARGDDAKDADGNFAIDGGCFPRLAALGMMLHGVVADARLPFDMATVNAALPWDVITAGYDAKVLKFHVIEPAYGRETEFIDELERTIASGYTVPFAQPIDRPFNDYTSGVLGAVSGPTRGSHYTLIRGYDKKRKVFLCDNSWSESWGKNGRYEMSYDRVLSRDCSNYVVLTTIPDARNIR